MNKFRFTLTGLAIMALTLIVFSSAQAQATRTWVSGVGDDANPCSRTAPCKTFAGAISKTARNGEIDALDPGGFGAVTIVKSITIEGSPTGQAGILNAGTSGVIINITDAADLRKAVTLRSISIQGAGSGTRGINLLAASAVFVDNCVISGQNGAGGNGIDDTRTTGGFLEVTNSSITNNSGNGVNINPSNSTQINAHIANSNIQGNTGRGVFAGSNAKVSVFNTSVTQNGGGGIFAQNTAGGLTEVAVDHSIVSNTNIGFTANTANSVIRVSNTTAMNNGGGLFVTAGGGLVLSYGNNQAGGLAFGGPVGQT